MSLTEMDTVDRQLLLALAKNSRASASELAKIVGLTRQSVTERLDRLRTDGAIRAFTLAVSPEKLGFTVRAYIAITLLPTATEETEREIIALLEKNPWVQECYRVTGDDYFQVRVVAPDIDVLRDLVLALRATHAIQGTRTMLALETLFEKTSLVLTEDMTERAEP